MFSRSKKRRDGGSREKLKAAEEPSRGQPCVTCGELCPGFSLHKWR
ncbi:hypothetical protein D4764_04G0004330 [Takifugu flavidus]|nr:hypothetical protein D4764_04G0004330 [Takifugu flavidus]